MLNWFKKDKVNDYNKTARSLITMNQPKSPISEQYRTIRTNLEFTAVDGQLQTILVTSAMTGEGKTTTSANLAVAYAQQGKRVLLVDGDLRRPTLHHTFRTSNVIGLSSVLARKATLEKAVQSSKLERLDLLCSGPIPPNPSELLSSNMMSQLLEELKAEYDVVLIDAPPIVQVADSRILAREVDGVVLVVSCVSSDRQFAVKAKEQLELAEAHILGVVLNHRESQGNDDMYYYYTYE